MSAESRAEYWKAEHTAANEEIEALRARVAELEAAINEIAYLDPEHPNTGQDAVEIAAPLVRHT